MGELMAPPGYSETYTAAFAAMDMMLDSRAPRPSTGSGAFLHLWGQPNFDVQSDSAWVQYGGAIGGAVDLTGNQRSLKMQLAVSMLDQVRGTAPVPFTEYLIFDGDMMAGFVTGLDDAARARRQRRSATRGRSGSGSTARPGSRSATRSASTSPVSGRASPAVWDIGLTTSTRRDPGFEVLFGLGTETFEQGADITSVRITIGSRQGF